MSDAQYQVSQCLCGRINYVGIASSYQHCVELDHLIRCKVRMAYWRQWRKPRTKVRNLMRLGVHVQAAVVCGITSKGPLYSFKLQGLYELRDGWMKLHHS